MPWSIHPGKKILESQPHRDGWQKLNRSAHGAHPVLDVRFVGALLRHFGKDGVRLALLEEDGELVSAALLERGKPGAWQVFLPSQAPLGPALFGESSHAVRERVLELARTLPGFVWVLGFLNQDPDFCSIASQNGSAVEIFDYATTVNISIDEGADFEAFWSSRPKRLRKKLRSLDRKLEQASIRYELAERRSADEIADAIAEHGRLESHGWKGEKGTAIDAENVQGKFYREVLESFCETGGACVYQLRFDDQVVASQLTIEQGGTMVLLKTAFDESRAEFSPGRLLDYLMLQRVFESGAVRRIEYYTKASEEDRRWTTGSRSICHVNHFRSDSLKSVVLAERRLRTRVREALSGWRSQRAKDVARDA